MARALPAVAPYMKAMYEGVLAPSVDGWTSGDVAAPEAPDGDNSGDEGDTPVPLPPPPPSRLCLPAERGAQQGDPPGPLLHAAALWLVLARLRATHPGALVRAFHDDVVAAGPPKVLAKVMTDAAVIVGGPAQAIFLVTSWRFSCDTHTPEGTRKSPTRATVKLRRWHQEVAKRPDAHPAWSDNSPSYRQNYRVNKIPHCIYVHYQIMFTLYVLKNLSTFMISHLCMTHLQ